MKVRNLFNGSPKEVTWKGKKIQTSIFRDPVSELKIENKKISDCIQADYRYHGGTFKEVYSYAFENYTFWKEALNWEKLDIGAMGENISTAGLDESTICLGDRFQIGDLILEANQPRIPCLKLNIRLNRDDGMKLFLESQRYGIYYKVLGDGIIKEGDTILPLGRDQSLPQVFLYEMVPLLLGRKTSADLRARLKEHTQCDPKILGKFHD